MNIGENLQDRASLLITLLLRYSLRHNHPDKVLPIQSSLIRYRLQPFLSLLARPRHFSITVVNLSKFDFGAKLELPLDEPKLEFWSGLCAQ